MDQVVIVELEEDLTEGMWGSGGTGRAPSLRTIVGVGVQDGLKRTAYMDDSSSGVGVPGLPTMTRLRRTLRPSSKAISSNAGMLTRTNLPWAGTAMSFRARRLAKLVAEVDAGRENAASPLEAQPVITMETARATIVART